MIVVEKAMKSHSVKCGFKVCCRCKLSLPAEDFYTTAYTTRQGKRSVRIEPRCKPCSRARRIENYNKDPEARRAVARDYKRNNPEKIRSIRDARIATDRVGYLLAKRTSEQRRRHKDVGPVQAKENLEVFRRVLDEAWFGDGWLDVYSGNIIFDPTIDHIVPISRGGGHDYWNLCVTSRRNNSRKRDSSLLQFLARRTYV